MPRFARTWGGWRLMVCAIVSQIAQERRGRWRLRTCWGRFSRSLDIAADLWARMSSGVPRLGAATRRPPVLPCGYAGWPG